MFYLKDLSLSVQLTRKAEKMFWNKLSVPDQYLIYQLKDITKLATSLLTSKNI